MGLNKVKIITIVASCLSFSEACIAKDLGVYGAIFDVAEPDFLLIIEEKLNYLQSSGKLNSFHEEHKNQVAAQIKRPNTVKGILRAERDRERKFDPSITLEEEIIIPDGGSSRVLYAKGTKVNPLDYMNFDHRLVFIDGEVPAQQEFVRSFVDQNPSALIILVSGEPGLIRKDSKEYFYYFDQRGVYCKRFNIQFTPSVVFQEGNEKVLTIKEILL